MSDNPEWTVDEVATAKPFVDVFPDLAAEIEPQCDAVQVAIDRDLVDRFKAQGLDRELRSDSTLREAMLSSP